MLYNLNIMQCTDLPIGKKFACCILLRQTCSRPATDLPQTVINFTCKLALAADLRQPCRILFQSCLAMNIHDEESAADLSQPSCRPVAALPQTCRSLPADFPQPSRRPVAALPQTCRSLPADFPQTFNHEYSFHEVVESMQEGCSKAAESMREGRGKCAGRLQQDKYAARTKTGLNQLDQLIQLFYMFNIPCKNRNILNHQ